MYVMRAEIHVKTGCLQELLSLVMEHYEKTGATCYFPLSGAAEVFLVDREYKTLAEADTMASERLQSLLQYPKDETLQKFDELIQGITFQIWIKV